MALFTTLTPENAEKINILGLIREWSEIIVGRAANYLGRVIIFVLPKREGYNFCASQKRRAILFSASTCYLTVSDFRIIMSAVNSEVKTTYINDKLKQNSKSNKYSFSE